VCAQFDTYDPARIKSHAGVRSDLYPRPLGEVRITDFLGAVSKVDVLPSDAGAASAPEEAEEEAVVPVPEEVEVKLPMLKGESSERALHPLPTGAEKLHVEQAQVLGMGMGMEREQSSTIRAWGAAGVVIALVAWRMVAAS